MNASFQKHLGRQLHDIRATGIYKNERVIITPQGTTIRVADGQLVLNFCANNYTSVSRNIPTLPRLQNARWVNGVTVV